MIKEDQVPWYTVARRLVPFVALQVLLRLCWLLVYVGYGKDAATEFYESNL